MYVVKYKNIDLEVKGNYTEGEVGDYYNPGYNHYFESTSIKVLGADYDITEIMCMDDILEVENLVLGAYYE